MSFPTATPHRLRASRLAAGVFEVDRPLASRGDDRWSSFGWTSLTEPAVHVRAKAFAAP